MPFVRKQRTGEQVGNKDLSLSKGFYKGPVVVVNMVL